MENGIKLHSKLIAVNGPPGSGKTTLTLKLAQELHEKTRKRIIYLSPDTLIPALGLIFPKREKGSLLSLGKALENVNLANSDILGVILTTKSMENMGYLGYVPGEGPHTYTELSEDKVRELFRILKENYDYIFVDCDRNREDMISSIACGLSDHLIQVVNPDIRSVAYYGFEEIRDNSVQVLTLLDNNIFLPIQDIKARFPKIQHTILYSKAAKMQMLEGELMDHLKDPVYRKGIKPIIEMILTEPEQETNEQSQAEEFDPADPLAAVQGDVFKK